MAGGRSRGPRSRTASEGLGEQGEGEDRSVSGLSSRGFPTFQDSPSLLTDMFFPGTGGCRPCALAILTPLPWGRDVECTPQGLGTAYPTTGGPPLPRGEEYSPALDLLRPGSQEGAAAAHSEEVHPPLRPGWGWDV